MLNGEICFIFCIIHSFTPGAITAAPSGRAFLYEKMNAHAPDYSEIDPDFMEEVIFINSAADYVRNYMTTSGQLINL